jgi:hypothetical protein
MMMLSVGQEANDSGVFGLVIGCWSQTYAVGVEHFVGGGCREPKQPKRDFVSNGWRHRRNQCGMLVEKSSVNNTKGSFRQGGRKKKIKNTKQEKVT